VISASFDESIRVWNIAAGKLVRTLTGHTEAVVGLDVKRDLLASSSDDKSVRLWRLSDGAHLRTMTEGNDHVYAVRLSTDAQWVVSGGREKGALGTLWKEVFGVKQTGSHDPTVRIWRARDGALMQAIADHADDVRFVALSRDGRWLATSSADKTVKLYSLSVRR
jgi:WD40 repeat protein